MSLYPSLEDMKVDQMAQAQVFSCTFSLFIDIYKHTLWGRLYFETFSYFYVPKNCCYHTRLLLQLKE